MIGFFAEGLHDLCEEDFKIKGLEQDDVKIYLQFALWRLEAQRDWHRDALNDLFVQLAADMNIKIRDLLSPMFIAIAGKPVSPPLFDSMSILGPDLVRARVRHAIIALGGISKKQAKKLEKSYRELG